MFAMKLLVVLFLLLSLVAVEGKEAKKKNVADYNDVDVERIFQEWEENDEDRDEDDDLENPFKPPSGPPLDLEALRAGKMKPEDLLKQSKKNKPVMMFVGIKGDPDEGFTNRISGRWMQSLQNAHLPVERYVVSPNRVLFITQDGSKAWDIKDYLVTQTECITVNFEQQSFPCKDSESPGGEKTEL